MATNLKTCLRLLIIVFLISAISTNSVSPQKEFYEKLNNFSANIFNGVHLANRKKSFVISPFAVHSSLTMARMGANGRTAADMDKPLEFLEQPYEGVVDNFHSLLEKYKTTNFLNISNKLYIANGHEVKEDYHKMASQKFLTDIDNIDLSVKRKAAATMNTWAKSESNGLEDLVKADDLSNNFPLVHLSTAHFKGNWKLPFAPKDNYIEEFYVNSHHSVNLTMMYRDGPAEICSNGNLDALGLRLHFNSSDLSMMFLLPNSRNNLPSLLENIKGYSLEYLVGRFIPYDHVHIYLPKFKTEFNIELSYVLKNMGMEKIFSNGDFSNTIKGSEPLAMGKVFHKAVVEVDEGGTVPEGLPERDYYSDTGYISFFATHPFYYVIMNSDYVPLLQGTFVGVSSISPKTYNLCSQEVILVLYFMETLTINV
ncbi:antichymotrypsin-2-like [Stomoxys calcitrans]|uniref:antichymotrypsin-2-like n=1 Tax=Stomoxys calcitrans TaxID=35570 RepID=UPI0027E3A228|nr:antichymotrypsin-2-like [Stomoxys calcitrans]